MKEVLIYTDGACSGNPGPGGYGAILCYGTHQKELSEGFPETTNNRMELLAAIVALETLREPCRVQLTSDSKYLTDAIQKGWAKGWRAKGWRISGGGLRKNHDLWERLLELLAIHDVTFHWVKGHAGHPMNERCDQLAVAAWQAVTEQRS